MNTSPFLPLDSQSAQKNKSRSRLKFAVFCVIAINVMGLAALLVQGCKREQPLPPPETTEAPAVEDTNTPPADPTAPTAAPEPVATSEPVAAPAPAPAPAPSTSEYVVVKGDSFFIIGKKLGVPWKAIAEANPGVDSTKLKIGQKLVIPSVATSALDASAGAAEATTSEHVYVVKSGDTLTKIAKDHGTTYKAIKAANGLVTDKIKVGQKLKIPAKEVAPAPAPEPAPAPSAEPAPAPAQ